MPDCIFCRIIRGEAPAKKIYEDEHVFVFEDINPQAPTHVLIIPKKHIVGLKESQAEDAEIIGYLHLVAAQIARQRGIEDGYRTVFNVGPRAGSRFSTSTCTCWAGAPCAGLRDSRGGVPMRSDSSAAPST